MKRIWAAVTAIMLVLLAAVSFSGCKREKVTLVLKLPTMGMENIADPDISDAKDFFERAAADFSRKYKKADVNINVMVFQYVDEKEAIENCFDTKFAPDILYEGYFNMQTYIQTGRVVPLDDIISAELREDVDESVWHMSSKEGKTYMLPFLSTQNILVYNKELLRLCGLEKYIGENDKIISWTLEEWEEILDTLAEKLPENIYPMMMYAKNDQGDTHIMTLLRCKGSSFFDDGGNFCLNTPKGTEALKWLQDGRTRGWYPPDCQLMEILDNTGLFINGQLAINVSNNISFDLFKNIDFGCVNFPSADGNGFATSFVSGFEVFDNGDSQKVTVAKDFVRYIMETEKWVDCSTNGIPAKKTVTEKYKDKIYMLDEFAANNVNVVDFTNNNPNWRGVREVFYLNIQKLLNGELSPEEAAENIDADCNAAIEKGRCESVLHE